MFSDSATDLVFTHDPSSVIGCKTKQTFEILANIETKCQVPPSLLHVKEPGSE